MTDKKISELTNITGSQVDDANDELAIVDSSTSETKAITRAELMSSVSAMSITGDLTVDTDTLYVNSSNDRVGIGTSSPAGLLHMSGADTFNVPFRIENTGGANSFDLKVGTGSTALQTNGAQNLLFNTNSTERMRIDSSGNVGIGTSSPASALDVAGTVTADGLTVNKGSDGTDIVSLTGGNAGRYLNVQSFTNSGSAGAGYDFNATSGQGAIRLSTTNLPRLFVADNGDISFYEDTGTTPKFFWDASAESLGIGTSSPSSKLDVNDTGASDNSWNTIAKFRPDLSNGPAEASVHIQSYPSTTSVPSRKAGIQAVSDAGVVLPLVINKDGGNIGIGTDSPSEKLVVNGAIVSGSGTKPINATYSEFGSINSFEHRFSRIKSGSNSPHVLVDIQINSNFHQAMFVIEYGARLQYVSDDVTNSAIRTLSVNRFFGQNINVTDTGNIYYPSSVSTHAPIYINVVSQTRYQIVVGFSGTLGPSSFVSGSIRGYAVADEFSSISFFDGINF